MRLALFALSILLAVCVLAIRLATPATARSAPALADCNCKAHPTYSNDCTCGISLISLDGTSALCSAPPGCEDLSNKCTASFTFAFVGQCGNSIYTLDANAPCDGSANSYKRCPGATTAVGLHLACDPCAQE